MQGTIPAMGTTDSRMVIAITVTHPAGFTTTTTGMIFIITINMKEIAGEANVDSYLIMLK